jgi:homoserine kinase type II
VHDAQGELENERTLALLKAYHTVRPLIAKEAQVWPQALRLAALRFWISRLYDLYLPRGAEIVHAHDPEHFKRILQNHVATARPIWL